MIELVNRFGIIPGIKKKYLIDSPEELTELDTTFGNEAYCIGDTKNYICNGSGEYVEKNVSGGKKLYQHNIYINTNGYPFSINATIQIVNESNEHMNYDSIYSYLYNHNFVSSNAFYRICGWGHGSSTDSRHVIGIYASDDRLRVLNKYHVNDGLPTTNDSILDLSAPITDIVIEL